MKKFIKTLGLLFLFTSFLGLSGCSKKDTPTTEETTIEPFVLKSGKVTVDFYQPGIKNHYDYGYGNFEMYAGEKMTFSTDVECGYNFIGWYVNDELVSTDKSYTVTVVADKTLNVIPKAEPYEELKNFVFQGFVNKGFTGGTEYHEEGVYITDVKDKTVEEIVVPEYVIGISEGAFNGCSNLKKLTIPRICSYEPNEGTDEDSRFLHFGYMFDGEEYENSILAESSINYYSYYIPASLEEVVLTNTEYIPTRAFEGYTSIKKITIPKTVKKICPFAFYNCACEIVWEEDSTITEIDRYAFYGLTNDLIIPISVRTIANFAISIGNSYRIFYEGSSNEWSNITIGTQSSSYSSTLKYYYSRVTPTTAGNFWHYDSNRDPKIWI